MSAEPMCFTEIKAQGERGKTSDTCLRVIDFYNSFGFVQKNKSDHSR